MKLLVEITTNSFYGSVYMARMIFAKQIDTGKIVSIDEVVSGLKCNCVCPYCNAKLEARKGKVRAHHFAHYDKDETSLCSESALHLAAKEILKEERKIALPSLKIGDDINRKIFEVLPNGYEFNYNNIEIEKNILVYGDVIRPDVIVKNDKATLAIEILVSHAVDDEKKEKIKQASLTTIEIDLNNFDIQNKETLRNILLTNTSNKKWIYSNQAIYFENKILKLCKNILVKDLYVKDCPLKIWQGRQFSNSIDECNGCDYSYEVNLENVLCLGDKRISKIDDLKLNDKDLQKHIEHRKNKELDNDRRLFEIGICPVCQSSLRVSNASNPYISCRNYKECKFTAGIDLENDIAVFRNRNGKKNIVKLPRFVHEGVESLQKNAKDEIEDIEKLFSMGLCPYCAERLVIREGEYGKFLGCKGYSDILCSCKFKAKLDLGSMTATFQTRHSPKRTIVKTIPESVIRAFNIRQQIQQRTFQIGDKDRRED